MNGWKCDGIKSIYSLVCSFSLNASWLFFNTLASFRFQKYKCYVKAFLFIFIYPSFEVHAYIHSPNNACLFVAPSIQNCVRYWDIKCKLFIMQNISVTKGKISDCKTLFVNSPWRRSDISHLLIEILIWCLQHMLTCKEKPF